MYLTLLSQSALLNELRLLFPLSPSLALHHVIVRKPSGVCASSYSRRLTGSEMGNVSCCPNSQFECITLQLPAGGGTRPRG